MFTTCQDGAVTLPLHDTPESRQRLAYIQELTFYEDRGATRYRPEVGAIERHAHTQIEPETWLVDQGQGQ